MNYYFDTAKQTCHIIDWIKEYFRENGGPDTKAIVGISGGKDSSVVAALCVYALGKERVHGVLMPQGKQKDINYAYALVNHLGISYDVINIGEICSASYDALEDAIDLNSQITSNLPARVRMSILYAVAAAKGGRVANTCNYSEDYVGYSTKFGDSAGDFAPIAEYTATEVVKIGKHMKLPEFLMDKPPEDGLSGLTDEENLGFSYKMLDEYLREGKELETEVMENINIRHFRNTHKVNPMPKCDFMKEEFYIVSKDELLNLLESESRLICLERGGVDDWEWYMEGSERYISEQLDIPEEDVREKDYCFSDVALEWLKGYRKVED